MEIYTCIFCNKGLCTRFISGSGKVASGAVVRNISLSDETYCEQPQATNNPDDIVCNEKKLKVETLTLVDNDDGAGLS